MPTLIENKKVFIAESPLFEITSGKNTYFAYNEKEKNEILKKMKGKYSVQRSKGLGENDPDMMWKTTMCPDSRKLVSVLPDDEELTGKVFGILLGDDLQGRKNFISDHGEKYLEMLDLS